MAACGESVLLLTRGNDPCHCGATKSQTDRWRCRREGSSMLRRASLVAGIAAVVLGLSTSSALASGTDLAVAYHIDVGHTGVQNDSVLVPPFVQRWQTSLPALTSYPLIANGKVYVTVGDNNSVARALYALDQQDGHVVWSETFSNLFPWSAPAYDEGHIFVAANASGDGLILAFDAATGAPLWTAQLPGLIGGGGSSSPPTAANGVVYTSTGDGTLYALDELTGNVIATNSVFGGAFSSPALSADSVFVSYECDQTYRFAQQTLAPLWVYAPGCGNGRGATSVYSNGQVFIRNDSTGNLVLDATTGTVIRSWAPPPGAIPAPAPDPSTLFLLYLQLKAEDRATGAIKWTFSGDGHLSSAPIVIANGQGELVIEGSSSGQLYALDASSGSPVWTAQLPQGIPSPNEHTLAQPLTGLAAGQGLLVVPTGNTLTAFGPIIGTPCPPSGKVHVRWHYSANGSKGTWSTAKATDCSTGSVSDGPEAMEGDLALVPGTTIKTGYDLSLPGNKLPFTAAVKNPTVVFQLRCAAGRAASPSVLTVSMATQMYSVTAAEWEPTADQKSALGYQGSATIPDACAGSRVHFDLGGTFSATILLH